MDDSTVKIGLLLEAAEAHQASAATALDGLRAHAAGLDGVVREEIRATLVEELQDLREHSQLAAASLRALARQCQCACGPAWGFGRAACQCDSGSDSRGGCCRIPRKSAPCGAVASKWPLASRVCGARALRLT